MKTVGQKLEAFSVMGVKPGFNQHEEGGVSAFEAITEASFPSSMEALAAASKHLTPKLLRAELDKLRARPDIFIYHLKAPFAAVIVDELAHELAGYNYRLLREHDCIDI